MKVDSLHVLVTGEAHGIGAALCRRFRARGARAVTVVDLDGSAAASGDGVLKPEEVAEVVIAGLEAEDFLILPQP